MLVSPTASAAVRAVGESEGEVGVDAVEDDLVRVGGGQRSQAGLAVGESSFIPPHPTLPSLGISIWMERGRQRNDSRADGEAGHVGVGVLDAGASRQA